MFRTSGSLMTYAHFVREADPLLNHYCHISPPLTAVPQATSMLECAFEVSSILSSHCYEKHMSSPPLSAVQCRCTANSSLLIELSRNNGTCKFTSAHSSGLPSFSRLPRIICTCFDLSGETMPPFGGIPER